MEHDEAIRSQAAERYVSHELSPEEQQAFEEHFFDCQRCADDVRLELTFAANVRAVSREGLAEQQAAPAPPIPKLWERWLERLRPRPAFAFSIAANFVLAAGFAYVLLTGTHPVARPQLMTAYFAPGPTHGGEDVHAIPPGETAYLVRFPAPSGASQLYSYEVLDAAGRRESSGSLQAPAGTEELYLQIPIGSLAAGVHTLAVRGGPGNKIVSWSGFHTSPR
jgi:anti-sigma factor RsiW